MFDVDVGRGSGEEKVEEVGGRSWWELGGDKWVRTPDYVVVVGLLLWLFAAASNCPPSIVLACIWTAPGHGT